MSKRTKYEDKYIKTNRTFPVGNTILLVLAVALQVGLMIFAFTFRPEPQDVIHQYNVTVEPQSDGSLDIIYDLVWEALDSSEFLKWVEIGMANEHFTVYHDSVSSTVEWYEKYTDGGYVTLVLHFEEAYTRGDIVEFSFRVNQKGMLCMDEEGYFYEFVPGWFNEIQVREYQFTWLLPDGREHTLQGSLDYGEYDTLRVRYGPDDFTCCKTVKYFPFTGDGAYNGLRETKIMVFAACCVFTLLLIAAEVYVIDSYVSYGRGRGFLSGYGYHVHTYGRTNPYYIKARDKHAAAHRSSGGRSGGCACACACACAGGGRAGCSQKDTFGTEK